MQHKEHWLTPLELPELPYAKDALAPVISEQTIEFHYGKHHKAYFDTTKDLVKDTALEGASLEEIVDTSGKDPSLKKLYNNAAQAWNHNLYWKQFAPVGQSKMPMELEKMLQENFGSVQEFKKKMTESGVTRFGSGWAWLVLDNGKLDIYSTPNGDNPWKDDKFPVFGLDVWEHAYYLDYQNLRKKHIEEVLDKIVNWDYVLELIKKYQDQQ
ncbi:MAG: superoxide dismutase [Anaerolineaceae bacterium]|jgi:Fe-Mn family superoxide dismutase|nr:superoxide dismutase [Anaerolineaceae bacterium]MDD4043121.1 superoxide dismutase [Anaerolineaceae bacterium]MDD4578243.1 superoxide dismutase [Anaerolineaceae bacterium]